MARRRYVQFCPVARSLDLLGERWTLLVLRDLLTGPQRFTDLRDHLGGLSANLLTERLRALEAAGLVERRELPPPAARTVYVLTDDGAQTRAVVAALARLGLPTLDAPSDEQPLMPHLLPAGLEALIRLEELPDRDLTARFALDEAASPLRLELVGSDDPPGARRPLHRRLRVHADDRAPADVDVETSLAVLLWIRRGDLGLDDARGGGHLRVSGASDAGAVLLRLFSPEPALAAVR